MEKGKGREQWSREGCCWEEGDAGCVPLPMLDWGPCHPAWHGGSARASCRTRLVWGVLKLELLLQTPRGVTEGRCCIHTCQVGSFPLSFGAVSAAGKELSLCHVCDCHRPATARFLGIKPLWLQSCQALSRLVGAVLPEIRGATGFGWQLGAPSLCSCAGVESELHKKHLSSPGDAASMWDLLLIWCEVRGQQQGASQPLRCH